MRKWGGNSIVNTVGQIIPPVLHFEQHAVRRLPARQHDRCPTVDIKEKVLRAKPGSCLAKYA